MNNSKVMLKDGILARIDVARLAYKVKNVSYGKVVVICIESLPLLMAFRV
jgi:hypothetical protein